MSTYTDNWDKDYNALMGPGGDLQTFVQEEKDYVNSLQQYADAMKKIEKTSDAMVAFTMLAWLMANEGSNELNLKTAVGGGALQIQGDLTRLGNDIEDMTNQNSPDPTYLDKVATRSYTLAQDLTNNSDLLNAIGTDAGGALAKQYTILRGEIYDTNASAGGVAGNVTTNQFYFDAMDDGNPKGYITSYQEFQTDLQGRGDVKSANEAAKEKTDAFNENTSTTQSTNAASQELISNDSNMAKAVQAFTVDMFHAVMDVMSAANKAATKGS